MHGLHVREWGDPDEPAVLLWPGLGSAGAYFAAVAPALAGRAVAVDPPGFGESAPPDSYRYEGLVALATAVFEACDCRAVVGHSLGAYLAVGLAASPPPALEAAVLIDGGFLDAAGLGELGMPVSAGPAQLAAWMASNQPPFPSWEAAIEEISAMVGSAPTPALEAYVRDLLLERDGEIVDRSDPARMADLLLATLDADVPGLAGSVAVPTLLLACAQPHDRRAGRQAAWERFAGASPLIELHVAEQWGHNPILQAPRESAELIGGWLRSRI